LQQDIGLSTPQNGIGGELSEWARPSTKVGGELSEWARRSTKVGGVAKQIVGGGAERRGRRMALVL